MMKKLSIVILNTALMMLPIISFSQSKKEDVAAEQTNMLHFHLVDFVGWNTSFPVLANYHTNDVKVFGAGWKTSGMKQHEEALKPLLKQTAGMKIGEHSPCVARGEWTGVVGVMYPGNGTMATIAKWRDGRIAEEYLFMVPISADKATKMEPSNKPVASFENSGNEILAKTVDVQPGWSCYMDNVNGQRTAFFIKRVNGKEVKRLIFQ